MRNEFFKGILNPDLGVLDLKDMGFETLDASGRE